MTKSHGRTKQQGAQKQIQFPNPQGETKQENVGQALCQVSYIPSPGLGFLSHFFILEISASYLPPAKHSFKLGPIPSFLLPQCLMQVLLPLLYRRENSEKLTFPFLTAVKYRANP